MPHAEWGRGARVGAAVLMTVTLGAASARAFEVELVSLSTFENRTNGAAEGFTFEVEVRGSDLVSVTATPPGGAPISVPAIGADEFLFSSAQYATLEALAGDFPEGAYAFTIAGNGASISGTLGYARSPTQGFVAIDAPENHAQVGAFPTFTVTNACTNCVLFVSEIEDVATQGVNVSRATPFGFPLPPLSTPSVLTLSDLSEGTALPQGLPLGSYEFRATGVRGTLLSDQSLAGDSSGVRFSYASGNEASNRIEFTVPEPASAGLGLAAALALITLGLATHGRTPGRPARDEGGIGA